MCSIRVQRTLNTLIKRGFADAKPNEIKVQSETPYVPPSSTLGNLFLVLLQD